MVVTSHHLTQCQEKQLVLMNFEGRNERQWNFDDTVRYIKIIGGPSKEEGLLLGLKNGNIYKIFLNNAFPIMLI